MWLWLLNSLQAEHQACKQVEFREVYSMVCSMAGQACNLQLGLDSEPPAVYGRVAPVSPPHKASLVSQPVSQCMSMCL